MGVYEAALRTRDGRTLILNKSATLYPCGDEPDVYAQSATQEYPLGTLLIEGERKWRYCLNGAVALDIAAPVQSAAPAHAEQDDDIAVGAAAAVGATTITLTSTANLDASPNDVANAFADGYLVVNDEAGEGQMYKIKSNTALAGTANFTVTLYEGLTVALTTSSQVGLVYCPYRKLIATTAVVSGKVIGVPLIAVTAGYYFWCQTAGPAPVVAHTAIAKGTHVIVGTTAAKADPMATNSVDAEGATEIIIGEAMTPAVADTETFVVWLMLES